MPVWCLWVLAIIVFAGHCIAPPFAGDSAPAASDIVIAAGDIVIAVVTDPSPVAGSDITARVIEITNTFNRGGGLLGRQFAVKRVDDPCSGDGGAKTAAMVTELRPALVIGHACAAAANAAAMIYARNGTLFISTSRQALVDAGHPNPTVFRLAGADARQGSDLAKYLLELSAGARIGLVHDRTRLQSGIATAIADQLRAANGTVPITATLVASEKDYSKVALGLRESKVVMFAGFPLEAGLLYRALRKVNPQVVMLTSDTVATTEFGATFGEEVAGVYSVTPHRLSVARNQTLTPPDAEKLAVAAIEIFASAAKRANSIEATKIATALASGHISQTIIGSVSFDTTKDWAARSFDMIVWTGTDWQLASAPRL